MKHFLQLHYLTVYPPSNPNRDDLGRPKSVIYGGEPRLRISSQALKRAARLSDVMQKNLEGNLGDRTRLIGDIVYGELKNTGADEKRAGEIAKSIAEVFGKLDDGKKSPIRIKQLAFISPDERRRAIELAQSALNGESLPKDKDLKKEILRNADGAVDIALFGRMLADDPEYNREAAAQVSHAFTTHRALIEDDYYTAVDDLKQQSEDSGAGFVGDAGFGSGVFYTYACVNTALLMENLGNDRALAACAVGALAEALAVSTPSGKRNSFAHHTRASYIRAEKGDTQPRSLAGAFFRPVSAGAGQDLLDASKQALEKTADSLDKAYGACAEQVEVLYVPEEKGNLENIRQFAASCVNDD